MTSVDHQFFQDRLSAYADNELPLSERAQFDVHLQACADCRRQLAEIQKLSDLVGQVSPLGKSEYWEKSAQKIENALADTGKVIDLDHERAKRSSLWWKMPAIAASVLILGYIGFHESDIFKRDIMVPPGSVPAPSTQPMPAPQLTPAEKPESSTIETPHDTGGVAGAIQPQGRISKRTDLSTKAPSPGPVSPSEKQKPSVEQPMQKAVAPAQTEQLAEPSAKPVAVAPSPVAQPGESNYVARYRERTAAAVFDTGAAADSISSAETLAKMSEEARIEAEELASWRLRRDSLLKVAAELEDNTSAPLSGALNFSAAPPKPKEQAGPLDLVSRQVETKSKRESAEAARQCLV